jgi:3-methyladenine DNA glycosylase AlkD
MESVISTESAAAIKGLTMIAEIQNQLSNLADAGDASFLQKYFKTGPGQYGEGDIFRGIRVPALRKLALSYRALELEQAVRLLHSSYHEDRLLALLILSGRFAKEDEAGRAVIYRLYLDNTQFINNWDLVDSSAERIVGAYLKDKDRTPLDQLAQSPSIWERRIAIIATFHYIRYNDFDAALSIAQRLLTDREDLIHKAVGWMLREVGKRDLQRQEIFLRANYRRMPRTMLRYAIEKFPEEKRQGYLKGTIAP